MKLRFRETFAALPLLALLSCTGGGYPSQAELERQARQAFNDPAKSTVVPPVSFYPEKGDLFSKLTEAGFPTKCNDGSDAEYNQNTGILKCGAVSANARLTETGWILEQSNGQPGVTGADTIEAFNNDL